MKLPPQAMLAFSIILALTAIAGFGYLFGKGIIDTLNDDVQNMPPEFSETYVYIATGLAGLVGGLVAAGFNQSLPPELTLTITSPLRKRITAVGSFIQPSQTPIQWREWLAVIYVAVYIIFGVAAIVLWAIEGEKDTPVLVKNLASVSFGLFLAIVRSLFSEP
ncbi:MAG: hypothetical protein L0154_17110 [Chloroflexi bacterium]|nr:hypothetical protein [Chloroflexota bacterium]